MIRLQGRTCGHKGAREVAVRRADRADEQVLNLERAHRQAGADVTAAHAGVRAAVARADHDEGALPVNVDDRARRRRLRGSCCWPLRQGRAVQRAFSVILRARQSRRCLRMLMWDNWAAQEFLKLAAGTCVVMGIQQCAHADMLRARQLGRETNQRALLDCASSCSK